MRSSLFVIGALSLCAALVPSVAVKAAPSSATESPAAQPELPAACADFVKAVCDKSGDKSQYCTDLKGVAVILPPAACKAANGQMNYVVEKMSASRKVCDKLVADLCRDIGKDTDTCSMVRKQTQDFPPERCTSMTNRYSEVLAELKKMEAASKPLDSAKQKLIAGSDAPSFGPANAKVTLVEFGDFQCPFCSKTSEVVQKIKAKYPTKVRFVFRQFPLSFHQNAHLAAEAALAANAQGKFWQYHDKLYANQQKLERQALENYANQISLDLKRFQKALDKKEFAAKVDSDVKLGGDVSVQGTPTLFINGKRAANATDFDAIAKLIDEALASAK